MENSVILQVSLYFLIYVYLNILAKSQILVISLYNGRNPNRNVQFSVTNILKVALSKKILTGKILRLQQNKLFTVLSGKFKFSAQDSDLEYLC